MYWYGEITDLVVAVLTFAECMCGAAIGLLHTFRDRNGDALLVCKKLLNVGRSEATYTPSSELQPTRLKAPPSATATLPKQAATVFPALKLWPHAFLSMLMTGPWFLYLISCFTFPVDHPAAKIDEEVGGGSEEGREMK